MCQYIELPSSSPIHCWVKTIWTREHTPLQYDPKSLYVLSDEVVYNDDVDERMFSIHSRFHMNGLAFCTKETCSNFNYDDSWIDVNGQFYSIRNILCDKNNVIYIVGKQAIARKIHDNLYSYHLSDENRVIKVDHTIQQCIAMRIEYKDTIDQFISRCKTRTQAD